MTSINNSNNVVSNEEQHIINDPIKSCIIKFNNKIRGSDNRIDLYYKNISFEYSDVLDQETKVLM